MIGFYPAVMSIILLHFSIIDLTSSAMAYWNSKPFSTFNQKKHDANRNSLSEKIIKFTRYKWNNIEQNDFENNISTWLNPIDGYLAAHSTPVHLIKFKYSSIEKNIETHKLGEYLREIYANLSHTTVDSFINNIRKKKYHDYNLTKNTSMSQPYNDNNVIYPEILLVLDYSFYELFKNNMPELITYVLAFWNGVDMRFRNLAMPKIRLNIAGIVIDEVDGIGNSRMSGIPYKLKAADTLENVGSYLLKKNSSIPLNSYDIIVQMTSLSLCDGNTKKKNACFPIMGISKRGRSCFFNTKHKHIISTAIIHDNGYFEGITTAAHELGHIMGIYHDGEKKNEKCTPDHNYIMTGSGRKISENNSKWSQCSLNNLREFLNSKRAFCLYNKLPDKGTIAKRFLPGKVMDLNTQCKKSKGAFAIAKDNENCTYLKCLKIKENNGYPLKIFTTEAPISNDGRSCGVKKFCLLNKCISEDRIY